MGLPSQQVATEGRCVPGIRMRMAVIKPPETAPMYRPIISAKEGMAAMP
jgi:hypothetical protein